MSNIKLLPCPFCGYDYADIEQDKEGFVYVRCHKSGCMARTDGCLNEEEAARLWNRREPIKKIIEELKNKYPINPYPNEFSNGRNLGNQNALKEIRDVSGLNYQ